ncbi:50S ribosomal protein L31 type B [Frankliniella fusca]|uniref:50S ribosomal protein L31 type B n=1 Tax=Frankliniella fusca TaxID=407009 RepID=A0AAE1I2K1_9NEOP|nr:50S ribosomal protein L31 type B [Frankliniella fusca]
MFLRGKVRCITFFPLYGEQNKAAALLPLFNKVANQSYLFSECCFYQGQTEIFTETKSVMLT